MQPQFSLFTDPPPPATWVTPPPINAAPVPQEAPEAAETAVEEEAQTLEPQVVITIVALEETDVLSPTSDEVTVDYVTVFPADTEAERVKGLTCPNCGSPLEGRKCKLFCPKQGCGYMVTCSEW